MSRTLIIVDENENEFEHGTIEIVKKSGPEITIKATVNLVMVKEVDEFQEELEALIAKYAI